MVLEVLPPVTVSPLYTAAIVCDPLPAIAMLLAVAFAFDCTTLSTE